MNAFALLDLPTRPGLNLDQIDRAFRSLAATHHPDKSGGNADTFAQLVEARKILSISSLRLRHLVDLHFPPQATPARSLPPDPELGFAVSSIATKCAGLGNLPTPSSPIARASLAAHLAATRNDLTRVTDQVNQTTEIANSRLQSLDANWPPTDPTPVTSLATEFTFLENWQTQLESARLTLESQIQMIRKIPQ